MSRTALLLVAAMIAAGPGPADKPTPLPPLNEKVHDFARSNLGRSVGDGECTALAAAALRSAGARRSLPGDRRGDYVWGEPVADFKHVLPGDILQFRDAVFRGKRPTGRGRWTTWHQEYAHHTAIVAQVRQEGKLITVLHQNVTVKGRDESEKKLVQQIELRMDSLQKGGWVKAYRPIPPGPAGAGGPPAEKDAPAP